MTRVEWSDIAKAARETSEALVGKDWVDAGIKARVLLADLADEVDRLAKALSAIASSARDGWAREHVAKALGKTLDDFAELDDEDDDDQAPDPEGSDRP